MEPVENENQEQQTNRLSQALRGAGIVVLLAAAVTFAAQGLSTLQGLGRFYAFLSFTGIVAVTGVICGLRLKDAKSARALLLVATTFVTPIFATLGAFVYGTIIGTPAIPQLFVVEGIGGASLALAIAIALLVVVPVIYAGFSASARVEAKLMTALFVLLNLLLLVPSRNPASMALMVAGMVIVVSAMNLSRLRQHSALQTLEGRYARRILLLPSVFILGRNVLLYPIDDISRCVVLGLFAYLLFFIWPERYEEKSMRDGLQELGFILFCYTWIDFVRCAYLPRYTGSVVQQVVAVFGPDYQILMYGLPLGVLTLILGYSANDSAKYYCRSAWITVLAVVMQLLITGGVATAIICIAVSVTVFVLAFQVENKGLLYAGVFGTAAGIVYNIQYAVRFYSLSPWLSLAIIGLTAVTLASYLENRTNELRDRLRLFQQKISNWR